MVKTITSFPSMTTTERNALTGVPTGTVILNTTTNTFEVWGGSTWASVAGATIWYKTTVTYLDLQAGTISGGGFITTIPFVTVPAKTLIGPAISNITTPFVAVGLGGLQGTDDTSTVYADFITSSTTVGTYNSGILSYSIATLDNLTVQGDALISTLTAGSIDIYYQLITLP